MAKLDKSYRRERKQRKARSGMRITGKSVFIIQAVLIKKGVQHKEKPL